MEVDWSGGVVTFALQHDLTLEVVLSHESDFASAADGPWWGGWWPSAGPPGFLSHPHARQQPGPQHGRQPGIFFLIVLP